jgi:hypothetical protein
MNTEIQAAKGRITDLKLESRRLALEIEDHRQGLKLLTAPLSNPEGYDLERIPLKATQMCACVLQLRKIKAEMAQLREEYGLPE